jgi:rSAM/selenodomain-associated transferase 1
MKRTLVIFAREPTRDTVKTRLASCLSQAQRIYLYKAFLQDAIDLAKRTPCEEKILAFSSEGKPRYIKRLISKGFEFYKQKGRSLGDRMHDAFLFAKERGADKIVIIGSDSPTLPSRLIEDAFVELDENDIVIGPSEDGGYYLIGVKTPCLGLFEGVKWSTESVSRQTIDNSRKLNKKTALLDMWYDVDDEEDLACMIRYLGKGRSQDAARWTKKAIKKIYLDK